MEKKPSNKNSNFFRREGFYVILFLCLCIVATVATLTLKNSKQAKKNPINNKVVENRSNKDSAQAVDHTQKNYDNALEVKKEDNKKETEKKDDKKQETAKVSKTQDTNFIKPVEGTLARVYSEDPVFWNSTSSYRSNLGIDIKTSLGKPVFSVADGKVEDVVTSSQDGVQIIVNHQNGLKTIYANLDPKVKVSKGQQIKKGDPIGCIGKTTLRSAYEKYGDHLHFAVMKGNNYINPSKYIKY
ncbi:M23 family metallopeptidase [Clostridium niameyense]|uniref:M23 family metallopeptidase n=1 Tax=Clostridium niameyense TaxID=1622073 RepID=A0A6M0RCL0_9CLOT|nr:M23 family metallopeptidase [Clostridium niameyense]NEZ47440.1 M23 family metallopeptidase [Clostridium niameyense]